ncbi:MAG: class I SAM-dependent methyltransferase [Candidatus Izemoplasmatales bacterium]|nr:class I SAM-dependent methyltransferase [Candidatus Izemoplasmatales bacterium]
MIRITDLAHDLLAQEDFHDRLLVDMTAGRGNDTLFLSQLSRKVIAFDVQPEAIQDTASLLEAHHITHCQLILDDHQNLAKYIEEPVAGAIYNLGYLPHGNKTIKTTASSTIASLEILLETLADKGIVILVVYQKHHLEESEALLRFTQRLSSNTFDVIRFSVVNKALSPYIIHIRKIKKELG